MGKIEIRPNKLGAIADGLLEIVYCPCYVRTVTEDASGYQNILIWFFAFSSG
jgi:hypothetical protein